MAGGWVFLRDKVNGIQQREEVKRFLAARNGRQYGGWGRRTIKRRGWWFKKVGPAQAPLQIRAAGQEGAAPAAP